MSVLRGTRKPGKKWSKKDRALALALTLYEADLCSGCGQPMSLSTGEHPHDYDIRDVQCMACAELEEFQQSERSKNLEPGTKTYVVVDE